MTKNRWNARLGRRRAYGVAAAVALVTALAGVPAGAPVGAAVTQSVEVGSQLPSESTEGQRYVSPTGNNDNDGLTPQTPWKDLSVAMTRLGPGDTLNVLPGVYSEATARISPTLTPATAAQRIIVRATTSNVEIRTPMTLEGADYWTFEGLNISGRGARGSQLGSLLDFRSGTGWIFRNAEICCYGAYSQVSVGYEAKNWTFSHNLVWSNPGRGAQGDTDHNMYVQTTNSTTIPGAGPSGPGYIERNIFAGAANGANIKLGQGDVPTWPRRGPLGVVVRNNTMVGAGENVRIAFDTKLSLIEDNLLVHATNDQDSGRWAIDPYCLRETGNIARDNAWWGIGGGSTTGPVGPNGPSGLTGCETNKLTSLSTAGAFPQVNPGLNGGTGNTADFAERTLQGGQRGDLNPAHFAPSVAAARSYGRHAPFDQVISGDWDGDGMDTAGGVIGNRVYLTDGTKDRGSATLSAAAGEADQIYAFGAIAGTDRYIAGDWDGDGDDEVGIYRPSDSHFYLPGQEPIHFGASGRGLRNQPLAGDWDGDDEDEVGFFDAEAKRVYLRADNGTLVTGTYFQFGAASRTYQAVVGDWNQDGRDEVGLWEASTGPSVPNAFHLRTCALTDSAAPCTGPGIQSVGVPAPTNGAVYQPVSGNWPTAAGTAAQGTDTLGYVSWGTWNLLAENLTGADQYARPYDG